MIRAEGLGKRFGERAVFEDVSFSVPEGGALALVGRSGCGKSTLLHILAGLTADFDGRIDIGGGHAHCSLVLQNYGLFPWKSVRENMELPLLLQKRPAAERRKALDALMTELGLEGLEDRYPARLSGGQQQRVALGRALVTRPRLLLLDEPFSSLDAITREHLQDVLAALWRQRGFTTVLVTHSIEEAAFLGQRILVLGGSPTRIVASLDNPDCGRDGYRFEQGYFTQIKAVRESLGRAEAGGNL